ncbi:MAG: AAA family ATPase, partial [Fibrobacteria bacterium]
LSLDRVRPMPPENHPDSEADRLVRGLACGTLHSLLRYNPGSGEFFHRAHRPLPADLVLIDEVSMVDIFALASLLAALEEGACLVLIGDMDQLPSVEAGSVLADLVSGPDGGVHPLRDNLILLDRSHRSEARILDVTRRINAMDGSGALAALAPPLALEERALEAKVLETKGPEAKDAAGRRTGAIWPVAFLDQGKRVCPEGGCRLLLPAGSGPAAGKYRASWSAWLDAWIDFHYLGHSLDPARFPDRTLAAPRRAAYADIIRELCALPSAEDPRREGLLEEIFAYLDQARILTFTRKGWHGAVNVNRSVRERLVRGWDPYAAAEGTGGFAGSPILILENDHGKGLFNGDVGVQIRIQGRDLVCFRRADSFRAFPAAFLPRHESAFAMTVHKSQGSEYDQALVLLPESGNRLLYKETLYTALTRARDFAGVYGPKEVFLEAVGRKVMRESGLPQYLSAIPGI